MLVDTKIRAVGKAIRGLWKSASAVRGETILIAESDEWLRRLLVERLHRAQYQTLEAADGAEAVRIAARSRSGNIHLLLADVRLPDLLGWDLAEILRLDHPRLKVVCFGRSPQDGWSRPRKISAAFLHLPRPFISEAVLQALRHELRDQAGLNAEPRRAPARFEPPRNWEPGIRRGL